ncbi:MAG: spore maturation protein [Deferribacteres bacterium]|nr:spore maturation protein [candidate division KSB1 bacterium]MCB9503648.1 spore maturation protein [Deferribacteres bacterium]
MSEFFLEVLKTISNWAIPVLLVLIPTVGFLKKVKVYEVFVEGAKEGFNVAIRIIPFLVAILMAISMFRASGAMDIFVSFISPITDLIGMPAEILPAAFMRPLSGSGTLGIITELINTHGPDSFIGNLASTIYGSTETTFYVLAVYFGSVAIKKTRHAVPAGLIADFAGIMAALFICQLMFGQ